MLFARADGRLPTPLWLVSAQQIYVTGALIQSAPSTTLNGNSVKACHGVVPVLSAMALHASLPFLKVLTRIPPVFIARPSDVNLILDCRRGSGGGVFDVKYIIFWRRRSSSLAPITSMVSCCYVGRVTGRFNIISFGV